MAATLTPPPTTPPPAPPAPPPSRSSRSAGARALGWFAALIAVATVGYGAWVLLNLVAARTTYSTRTFAATDTVVFDMGDSSVRVVADRTDRVVVERKVLRGLTGVDTGVQREGDALVVKGACLSNFNVVCSVSTTVHVPADTDLAGHTGKGSVRVQGVRGSLHLSTGNGSFHVQSATGRIWLHTGNGSVRVSNATPSSLDLRTGNGSLHSALESVPGDIRLRTGNGSIELTLPKGAPPYALESHTGNGSVENRIVTDPRAPRHLAVRTGNGSIHLGYAGAQG